MWVKSVLVGVLIVGIGVGNASAKTANASPGAPASRYASIVVDFDTGNVLYERNADFSRYPASLTKIMTLYLAFEALKAKRITLDKPMKVSEYAACRDPSRLGLTPGGALSVEQAVRGMTTKSANDAAAVLAEQIGGCESKFAELMTAKGKALGMTQTTFYNASGLPAPGHVSSARDLAILARALIRDFPEYYHYFSLGDFEYRGKHWGNQNRFLRTYWGADGIKTGFIYSSGHNLAASAVRGDNKRLITIVLGGDTAGWTREHASRLMDVAYASIDPNLIVVAEAKPERAPMQEVGSGAAQAAQPALPTQPAGGIAGNAVPVLPSEQVAAAAPKVAATVEQAPAVTSPSPATAMLLTPSTSDAKNTQGEKAAAKLPHIDEAIAAMQLAKPAAVAAAPPSPAAATAPAGAAKAPSVAAAKVLPTKTAAAATTPTTDAKKASAAAPAPAASTALQTAAQAQASNTAESTQTTRPASTEVIAPPSQGLPEDSSSAMEQGDGPTAAPAPPSADHAPEGWSVQVGVYRDASQAKQRGEEVRTKMPVHLRSAPLIVDAIGDGMHVSSRFVMVTEKDARQACTDLQRGRIPCVVIPPGRPMVVVAN